MRRIAAADEALGADPGNLTTAAFCRLRTQTREMPYGHLGRLDEAKAAYAKAYGAGQEPCVPGLSRRLPPPDNSCEISRWMDYCTTSHNPRHPFCWAESIGKGNNFFKKLTADCQ